jgi:hypothetical protein
MKNFNKILAAVLLASSYAFAQTTNGLLTNDDIFGSNRYMYGTTITVSYANGTLYATQQSGDYNINLPTGGTMKFHTNVGINGEDFSNQQMWGGKIKHHHWEEHEQTMSSLLDMIDQIPTSAFYYEALYKTVQPAVVQISLEGTVQSNLGIQFKDPWRVVVDGQGNVTQPGNWDSYSVPFTPGTGNFLSYGGIFTSIEFDPNNSYNAVYQAQTDLTKTINGINANFCNWTTSNATVLSPTLAQTQVRFDAANATVTANYKGNLRTGRPDLSNTINQRRLITTTDNNNWVMVYESMGNVYLTNSVNGGVNWLNEVQLNVQVGAASDPTISNVLNYNGTPYYMIAWVETVGGTSTLHFQTLQLMGSFYWGWKYYADAGQNSTNHITLNQIPQGQGGSLSSFPLRADARPVVSLTQNGNAIKTYFAFEGSDGYLYTGFMTTPLPANDLAGTYLDKYGLDPYVRKASLYTAYYPVIITYPASYGYPAETYMYFLSSGYASGKRVALYDFNAKSISVLSNPNNDYTYYSLQGAASPANGQYGLVADAFYGSPGTHYVNFYFHPTYYGTSIPGPSVVATNMSQPTEMLDQSNGYGTGFSGAIVMKSGSDNNFYQYTGPLAQINTNASVAGVFAKEQTVPGDRTSMIVKTTSSPALLTKYSGSGLAKTTGGLNVKTQAVRIAKDDNGNEQRIALDISDANVEVIDSLESGNNICVLKVNQWSSSVIRQVDSLIAPLSVAVMRDGKAIRSFNASLWRSLTPSNLSGVEDGDIIAISLNGKKKTAGFTLISLDVNSLGKENNNAEALIPTEKNISVFPNPFNPTTTFRVSLPQAGHARLLVYNTLGQKVATVLDGYLGAGQTDAHFDGSNLASGVYIYRLEMDNYIQSDKMLLMK